MFLARHMRYEMEEIRRYNIGVQEKRSAHGSSNMVFSSDGISSVKKTGSEMTNSPLNLKVLEIKVLDSI